LSLLYLCSSLGSYLYYNIHVMMNNAKYEYAIDIDYYIILFNNQA